MSLIATPRDLTDLFRGLVFYGTGGGGRAATGLTLLRERFGESWLPQFASPAELPGGTLVCATIVVGGRDPEGPIPPEALAGLGLPEHDLEIGERFVRSARALQTYLGEPIGALVVVELGSVAMAATLAAADVLQVPVLDCDGTGRSIPELGLSKFDLAGVPPSPLALVDRYGGETIIAKVTGAAMADRMSRFLSRAVWGRGLACVGYPQKASRLQSTAVLDSVSKALAVGRILGADRPVDERLASFFEHSGGRVLFRGVARAQIWRSAEPYAFREFDYHFDGFGPDSGAEFTVWVKNEHHLVWREDALIATSPDPIAILDAETLEPLTTLGDLEKGRALYGIVAPSLDPAWRTEVGRSLLGPRRFGFNSDAVLIE